MEVFGCVGVGSFGKVFKVQVEGQLFALKKVPLQFDCDDDSPDLISLRNEVKIQERLCYHPNVVRCYKAFRKQDYFCILMEYVGHQTLDDLTLPLTNQSQIVNLIIQLCMGLKHLKHNHIIHRDIKPNNILISEKGLLKIGDFGVSKQVTPTNGGKTCLGTPYYSAPEIIEQKTYDYSVDVWSLGVVLYELTHARLPFLGKNMPQLRSKISYSIPQIQQSLHSDIRLVIRRCLSKNSNERITLEEILKLPLIQQQMYSEIRHPRRYF